MQVPIVTFLGLAAAAAATPLNADPHHPWTCLTDTEASQIATRYLSLYDTGAVTQLSDVTSVVTPGFLSYDGTGTGPFVTGPATNGSLAFYESLTADSGPSSFTDSTQTVLFAIHNCDMISYRWQFEAVSTGYNATVPAGTNLAFKGTDIIAVDLHSRLVREAISSGDWINLARELGQIGNFFP